MLSTRKFHLGHNYGPTKITMLYIFKSTPDKKAKDLKKMRKASIGMELVLAEM